MICDGHTRCFGFYMKYTELCVASIESDAPDNGPIIKNLLRICMNAGLCDLRFACRIAHTYLFNTICCLTVHALRIR